jgi:hypothetical protein
MQRRGGSPIRDGQGGEFRDRGPDELADRRGPQAAAFRDRSQTPLAEAWRRFDQALERFIDRQVIAA